MSSFLFLHFCDDVSSSLRLYFSASILSRISSGGFLPLPSKPPQGPHTASTGLVWGFAGVAFLPGSQNRTRASTGPSLFFSPKREFTPPPLGGGAGYHLSWVVGFALLVHNRATLAQQGLSGASLVSFPYLASKTAHRATQGRAWFHRRFLVCFCSGSDAKSRSSL